ncbi:MAG: UvrB/UvrC motif-containing protein [candidate division KSB1 bacterium]|nr:UvrB/UvrC motif-containing protein [candidate division KSB1 bacterium]MDZ7272610.1 UvrB/UvrC motif-containing protein [candidate division KSB1 bacterium]MDZ7284367.1 UvrB/UvrC motif-containing protein [candidate division KSB1 bacterium]MDZ7297237.1 UvrB/UvrC motif-containing protein [candidate division KSB1 bacterium]MDZ7308304.1 UvrB/UvrC motif-containing protein [candidate division KSB1 bacterium]
MTCQSCHNAKATVRLRQIVNGKQSEIYLCQACAQQQGLPDAAVNLPDFFGKVVNSILGQAPAKGSHRKSRGKNTLHGRCLQCGLTRAEFDAGGLLGCAACYTAFEPLLKVLLRNIHGRNRHTGRRPRPHKPPAGKNVAALRQELERAIGEQKFERAAELRDAIRAAQQAGRPSPPATS